MKDQVKLVIAFLAALACFGGPAMSVSPAGGGMDRTGTGAADAGVLFNLSTATAAHAGRTATISITSPWRVNSLTIPQNIRLVVSDQGRIEVAAGKTLVINGPFSAPPARVFTGRGTVSFGPESLREVFPEWWGADDGRESASAIQSAIDSLSHGTVVLAEKTYLLDRRVRMTLVGSHDPVDAVLVPKSGVNLAGHGPGSVLRLADGFTRSGDYVLFGPCTAEETSDIAFSNFTIDGNGSRNLVKGSAGSQLRRAMAIWLFRGKNVHLDNVRFENHPGTNVVKFGSDNLSYLVTDSVISNCTFSNVGGAIPGNRGQSDHSTIYVSGRDVSVSHNRLSNPLPYDENGPPPAVVAGIEMHGDNMVVADNRVENYGTGGYIVGDGIVTARNQRWTGNTFRSMTKLGISIWSITPVSDAVIEGNGIELNGALDQGVAGVFQPLNPPDTTVGIDGITVRNNRISGADVKPGTVWNGIQFTGVKNAVIENNVIERIAGAGILLYGNTKLRLDCRTVSITNNTVRDTGFNRYGAYPFAIEIVNGGLGSFAAIDLSANVVERTLPLADGMRGIRVQGPGIVRGVRIDRTNRFVNLPKEHRISVKDVKEGITVEPPLQ